MNHDDKKAHEDTVYDAPSEDDRERTYRRIEDNIKEGLVAHVDRLAEAWRESKTPANTKTLHDGASVSGEVMIYIELMRQRRTPVPADTPSEECVWLIDDDEDGEHDELQPHDFSGDNGECVNCFASRPTPPEEVARKALEDAANAIFGDAREAVIFRTWLRDRAAALAARPLPEAESWYNPDNGARATSQLEPHWLYRPEAERS